MIAKVSSLGTGEEGAVVLAAVAGLGLLATGEVEGEGEAGVEGEGEAGVEGEGEAAWGVAGPDEAPGAKKLGDRPAGRAARLEAAEVMPWYVPVCTAHHSLSPRSAVRQPACNEAVHVCVLPGLQLNTHAGRRTELH